MPGWSAQLAAVHRVVDPQIGELGTLVGWSSNDDGAPGAAVRYVFGRSALVGGCVR